MKKGSPVWEPLCLPLFFREMIYPFPWRITLGSQYRESVTALHLGVILIVRTLKDELEFPFSPLHLSRTG